MKLKAKHEYNETFLGIVPASNQVKVVDRIKTALKGTGFTLRRCARNANRRQFYHLYPNRARHYCGGKISQRGGLQQDLPMKHATHVALYLKVRDCRDYKLIGDVKAKVARALTGLRCGVTVIKSVKADKIHEVVTAIAAW